MWKVQHLCNDSCVVFCCYLSIRFLLFLLFHIDRNEVWSLSCLVHQSPSYYPSAKRNWSLASISNPVEAFALLFKLKWLWLLLLKIWILQCVGSVLDIPTSSKKTAFFCNYWRACEVQWRSEDFRTNLVGLRTHLVGLRTNLVGAEPTFLGSVE